ncbi:hypothetical protein K4F52_001940 [Lecanicillium sp. MT-2017a]|nr:hypothetical protein K4F52_001940 [Lecanicillium sp. MT-2017a]
MPAPVSEPVKTERPTWTVIAHLICVVLDVTVMVLLLKKHSSFYPHKDSSLPLIVFAALAIPVEFALAAITVLTVIRPQMRIVRKSPIVLVNLVMFVIHLVMPIVIITTWEGYYDIRVYSQYSGEPKYEKCAKKDIYTDDYHVIDKWCQGYRGTPVSFAHGDVHTSCILFWVIAAFHLGLAAIITGKNRRITSAKRELQKEAREIELQDKRRPKPEGPPRIETVGDRTVIERD